MSEPVQDDARSRIVRVGPDLPPSPFAVGLGRCVQPVAPVMAERTLDIRVVTRASDGKAVA